MASSMHSLKQKETMPEALAPPPYWTSIISLFPIEKNFFFQFNTKLLLQEQGLQKVRSLMMKTTHHKIGQTLVILAQEWEVEAQYDGYRNCSFDSKELPRPSTSLAFPSVTFS